MKLGQIIIVFCWYQQLTVLHADQTSPLSASYFSQFSRSSQIIKFNTQELYESTINSIHIPIFIIISYQVFHLAHMEIEAINDEKFEAMLDSLRVTNPNLLCPSGYKIVRLCSNPNCKLALQCGQDFCKSCGINVHQFCQSYSLALVTQILNSRVEKYKEFASAILQIDSELIKSVNESKKELTSRYLCSPLPVETQKLVDQIYKSKSVNSFSGQDSLELMQKMQEMRKSSEDRMTKLVSNYKEAISKMIKDVVSLKKGLYADSLGNQVTFDSVILKSDDQLSKDQFQFLRQQLNYPSKIELLYRGSKFGFKASIFHQKCGNAENTLTLVRTEFGKTIAAFTPYAWHSVPNENPISNPAGGSFILSLDLKEKLISLNTSFLNFNSSNWGPRFGNYNDMGICDECNSKANSFVGVIQCYNTEDNKYQQNQATYQALSGATNSCYFKVIEYEVFRIIK